MENCVITIARGFGSGGRTIASKLAKELGIHSYENRILTYASRISGWEESKLAPVDEKLVTGLIGQKLLDLPKRLMPHFEEHEFAENDKLFQYQKQIIEQLADTESCIIVGKCADHILKNRTNVLSVYIEAPRDYCVERVLGYMDISEKEANHKIERTDHYRAEYYNYYTHGIDWRNPINYDLTLNSGRLHEEGCMHMIKECMRHKFGNEWYEEFIAGAKKRIAEDDDMPQFLKK